MMLSECGDLLADKVRNRRPCPAGRQERRKGWRGCLIGDVFERGQIGVATRARPEEAADCLGGWVGGCVAQEIAQILDGSGESGDRVRRRRRASRGAVGEAKK